MGKLREYSYLIMLSISMAAVAFVYWGDLLPDSLLKEIQQDTIAKEHMTLAESEETWENENLSEKIIAYFSKDSVAALKEAWQKNEWKNSVSDFLFSSSGIQQAEGRQEYETTKLNENQGNPMSSKEAEEIDNPGDIREPGSSKKAEEIENPENISKPESSQESEGNEKPVNGKEPEENEKLEEMGKPESSQKPEGDEKPRAIEFYTGDASYFKDALFIGDSRTEGLNEYGGLGEAAVICDSGLSIYRLWKDKFSMGDMGKVSFEEILRGKRFSKVYLMLGINELGYDHNQTIKKYEETLRLIEETQPGATVFLMANLHVTGEKSQKSDVFNNEKINYFNRALEALARKKKYVYLDVNPLFDDTQGNLSEEYTYDHAHILGVYYIDWVNWILEHCV